MKRIAMVGSTDICYNTLNLFGEKIKETLCKMGYEVDVITEISVALFDGRYDAFFAFNSAMFPLKLTDGRSLFDLHSGANIHFIVDHPIHHQAGMLAELDNYHVICLDEEHAKYIKRFYPGKQSVWTDFLIGSVEKQQIPYAQRSMDILFTGSYMDECKPAQKVQENIPMIQQIYTYVVTESKRDTAHTIEYWVERFFAERHCPVTKQELADVIHEVFPYADGYLRAYYRNQVIKTLLAAGIQIHVYGKDWEKLDCPGKENLILGGAVDSEKTAQLTADAKILLNVMPWFKNGLHDRVLTAMHSGSVCLTDENTYIRSHFVEGKEIVTFSLERLWELPGKVRSILEREHQAAQLAAAGKRKAEAEYTWEQVVEPIVAILEGQRDAGIV